MAALCDVSAVAKQLSSSFFGRSLPPSSLVRPETGSSCVTRCSAAAPRSRSPRKNRDNHRPSHPSVPRTDSGTKSLATSLFGEGPNQQLAPGQRLEAPRAALLCDIPATEFDPWSFSPVQEEDSSSAQDAEVLVRNAASAPNLEEWLTSGVGQKLSWQRSILESHWLLDLPERDDASIAQEEAESSDHTAEGVRQVKGTTRRNRIRRRHVRPGEAEGIIKDDVVTEESDAATVVARSTSSARARRLALRKQQDSPTLASSAVGSLSKLNLQRASLESKRSRPAVTEEATPLTVDEASEKELAAASVNAWQEKPAVGESNSSRVENFMRDIGHAKLLTKEEEVELSTAYQAAEKLKRNKEEVEVEEGRELGYTEWASREGLTVRQLRHCLKEGEHAKERLMAANMRLVISVAKKYSRPGVGVSELITAGTIGLAKGVDRFDATKGFKLSTYVHWWIRQAVTRAAAEHVGAYRLPMHVHETLAKIKKIKATLLERGQAPSAANIATTLCVSEKRICKTLKLKLTAKSLDDAVPCRVGFSEGASFHNFVKGSEEEGASWSGVESMLLKKDIQEVMEERLDARERDIIRLHYGLNSEESTGMALDKICLRYGVSRERVRQVEIVAIRKLRDLCAKRQLQRYCY